MTLTRNKFIDDDFWLAKGIDDYDDSTTFLTLSSQIDKNDLGE